MGENPVAVCSPALLDGKASLSPDDIAQMPLLQQTTRPYAWRQWFSSQEMSIARDMTGPRYELFSMLAQAASHEMGIALIPPFLIQRELAERRLVIANPHALSSPRAYHLMVPVRKMESASVYAFRLWLTEQSARYEASST
jgi:DNA-binding transcriptional LysR family regulator